MADAADLVFLTTPDDAIEPVAASLTWRPDQAVVHCSGARSLDVLTAPRRQGAVVGSFHPMQTFPEVGAAAESLEGIAFGIEAEGGFLLETLQELAKALGGWPVVLRPQDKALYHASAIIACGYLLAALDQAAHLWEAMGHGREEGLKALLPLAQATLQGAGRRGLVDALSGPLARGDVGTVQRHLEALRAQAPEVLPLYCRLGLASLPLARAKGKLSPQRAEELQAIFDGWAGLMEASPIPPIQSETEVGFEARSRRSASLQKRRG